MIIVGLFLIIIGLLFVIFPGKLFKFHHRNLYKGGEPTESAKILYVLEGIPLVIVGIILIIADIQRMTS